MTTSNPSEYGDLTDRESVGQATIDLQAEKVLKVVLFHFYFGYFN